MAATVIIEARDLDTDARTRTVIDAICPARPSEQRAELVALVARVHPEARLRSFADRAASFLDSRHLIVASYGRRAPRSRVAAREGEPSHEALSLPV
jgi:hypothetical protein